jgi:hypothetical protein
MRAGLIFPELRYLLILLYVEWNDLSGFCNLHMYELQTMVL